MKSPFCSWHTWWKPAFDESTWEALALRVLIAWIVWSSVPDSLQFATQPIPNGLALYFDLTWIAEPGVWPVMRWTLLGALVVFVSGRMLSFAGLVICIILIWEGTLRNSQGDIGHGRQMVSLVMLAMTACYLLNDLQGLFRRDGKKRSQLQKHQLGLSAARQVVVACYVVSAITKIERSNGTWLFTSPNLGFGIFKTHAQRYYNSPETESLELLERGAAIGEWLVSHPILAAVLLSGGLFIELFAFVALANRRTALVYALALIGFHQVIWHIMFLRFSIHEDFLWALFVNPVYWVGLGLSGLWRFWRKTPGEGLD
ncbi:MAG: hypothetical protein ACFCU3_01900 [Verrucomicrobiales bacterium]